MIKISIYYIMTYVISIITNLIVIMNGNIDNVFKHICIISVMINSVLYYFVLIHKRRNKTNRLILIKYILIYIIGLMISVLAVMTAVFIGFKFVFRDF